MLVIHASDLHLGRPLRGIRTYEGLALEAFAHCELRALHRLVELCLTERAALLLIAGDLIDHWQRDYQLGLRLVRELERLDDTETQVFWVRGNHDAENRVVRNLLLPAHVRELGLFGVETVRLDHLGVHLVGRSFPKRCTENDLFAEYPAPEPSVINIGLLHTSADGRTTGDHYAPCGRRDLVGRGYQYLALGHVHEPEILSTRVPVAYSGCLQARSFLESGPRGCLKVHFDRQEVSSLIHQPLDVVRFGRVPIDVSLARTLDDVASCVSSGCHDAVARTEGTALVVRCCLFGDRGLEPILACSSQRRTQVLYAAAESVAPHLSVDGFWGTSSCPEAPVLRLDDPCLGTRRDI